MNILSILVLCAASITFSVGVYHLMYGIRLRDRAVDMAFAVMCFLIAAYDLAAAFLYSSRSILEGVYWQRWELTLLCAVAISLIWFVASFARRGFNRLDYVFCAYWALQMFFMAVNRGPLTLSDRASVKSFNFFGVFPVTYYEVEFGLFATLQGPIAFGLFVYVLASLVAHYRRGHRREAMPILIGMSLLFLGIANDTFVAMGLYESVYLIELSYLALIICMGYSLNEMHLRTRNKLQGITDGLQRLEAAVSAAAESIIITDTKGVIVYVNPAFEEMTGYAREDALGKNASILKSGKHDEKFYDKLWKTLSAGEVWSGHFTNRKKDGTLFNEEAVISPVCDARGSVVNFVAVKRDITQELLLENQLRHSQKMEALGQLASGVAHDFTNMLAIILGHLQFLKAKVGGNEDVAEHLDTIADSTEKLAALTGDLLAFANQRPLSPKVMDLNKVVNGMEDMLERTIENNIDLQVNLSEGKLVAELDANHIEQAIMYLVVNALDAMPDGGRLMLETSEKIFTKHELLQCHNVVEEDVLSGRFAVLSVTDTGCGMTEEVAARVFEPFFTTKGKGRTTGLGLSTAYGIVSQHGGYVSVYSSPGYGTTFTIYLPLAEAFVDDRKEAYDAGRALLKGKSILMAEDNFVVRRVFVSILQDMGCNVLEAEDTSQAMELFRESGEDIALLVTDIMMPETGGAQLAKSLREIKPGLKVIFASGYPRSHLEEMGIIDGGEKVISKPLDQTSVLRAIKDIMDN